MSPAVVPAKVWLFEKRGVIRVLPPVALARMDGSLVVPKGWLNAVKAQYTRLLRGERRARRTSLTAVPEGLQAAIVETLGQAWRAATLYKLDVGDRRTVGATAFHPSRQHHQLCIFTEAAERLAEGFALPGDHRITWIRS